MKKYLTRVRQLGPDPKDQGSYELPLAKLGTTGYGTKQAWVRHESGRWSEMPGYSKLYYDFVATPQPWWGNAGVGINPDATALLQQTDTKPVNKKSRLLSQDEVVVDYAWLVHSKGMLMDCFPVRACNADEVYEYIDEHFLGDFEAHAIGDKLYVYYLYDVHGDSLRAAMLPHVKDREGEGFTSEYVEAQVAQYRAFPTYARLRWA